MSSLNVESILPLVEKPSRYLGNEYNSIHKTGDSRLKIGLCFPDVYEIGMSNLAVQILYNIINERRDAVAERIFSPGADLENILRRSNYPLFSLESKRPLKEFDILGFSLSCELCYTNVLNILEIGQIPLLASQRDERFPLIIAGGVCAVNPEPMADFIDVFVLGEGEEVIGEIIDKIRNPKSEIRKEKLMRRLARIPGAYVPSFYDVCYFKEGKIKEVKPIWADVPARIHKRVVKNLDKAPYPVRPVVPYADIVHNRSCIEIARGCGRGCRFCQAGIIYRPVRKRTPEKILQIAHTSLQSTGDEEVSLLALSPTDYPGIERLIRDLKNKKIKVSLPSQRMDSFSLSLVSEFDPNRKMKFTFAPEAGMAEMRNLINKPLEEEKFFRVLKLISEHGWKLVKLYFMVGLPEQGWEDIKGMVRLMKQAKSQSPRLNFNFTISPFVPKAHTPFQWVSQATPEELAPQIQYLRRHLPGKVKAHDPQANWVEGIFSRGDRRLGKVVLRAFSRGCKFDLWTEQFKFQLWQEAFKECGVDADFYTRSRDLDEILAWDHLEIGVEKSWLLKEYKKALTQSIVDSPQSIVDNRQSSIVNQQSVIRNQQSSIINQERVRLKFCKEGDMRFLSYLELRMTILRALWRAKVPLQYSNGFHPQPKVCFSPPLSLGVESSTEFVDLWLSRQMELKPMASAISEQLPDGLRILQVGEVPLSFPSLTSIFARSLYEIILPLGRRAVEEKVEQIHQSRQFYIHKQSLRGDKTVDLKQSLIDLRVDLAQDGKLLCWMKITPGVGNLPRVISRLFDVDIAKVKIKRLVLE